MQFINNKLKKLCDSVISVDEIKLHKSTILVLPKFGISLIIFTVVSLWPSTLIQNENFIQLLFKAYFHFKTFNFCSCFNSILNVLFWLVQKIWIIKFSRMGILLKVKISIKFRSRYLQNLKELLPLEMTTDCLSQSITLTLPIIYFILVSIQHFTRVGQIKLFW